MHLDSFKLYCDVFECKSFSKAAEKNGVTQSTVSQSVQHLEDEFGVKLINRNVRPLELTEVGHLCRQGMVDILDRLDRLKRDIGKHRKGLLETVMVSSIYSVGFRYLQPFIEKFRMQNTQARVGLDYKHPDEVIKRVQAGVSDFGIVSFAPLKREFNSIQWREEKMVLVSPPVKGDFKNGKCSIKDIDKKPFVHFDRGLTIRGKMDSFFKECNVRPDVVMEFDNIESIKSAVSAGAGISYLPEETVRYEADAGMFTLVRTTGPSFARPLTIIYRKDRVLSQAAAMFISILQSENKN
jgi:DNA-binding transcriptional LysR family regulator